ncbi:MAG: hypothetical protein LQ340_008052, partial [Diploschistes diacapsis]
PQNQYLSPPGPPFHGPHLGPIPNQVPGVAAANATSNGAPTTPQSKTKPKPAKRAKPRAASKPSSKVTKSKATSGIGVASQSRSAGAKAVQRKQRPQSSKHLTPSLRAAIITLKVATDMSFKEIGDLLAIPVEESEADDKDGNVQQQQQPPQLGPSATAPDQAHSPLPTNNASGPLTHGAPAPALPPPARANAAEIDPNLDPSLADHPMPITQALAPLSATVAGTAFLNPIPSIHAPAPPAAMASGNAPVSSPFAAATKPKSKTRPKRRPIPRNTVAGIFKRVAQRAGTETDLYKLLGQTGRRPGSGRPRKGEGKKDREVVQGGGGSPEGRVEGREGARGIAEGIVEGSAEGEQRRRRLEGVADGEVVGFGGSGGAERGGGESTGAVGQGEHAVAEGGPGVDQAVRDADEDGDGDGDGEEDAEGEGDEDDLVAELEGVGGDWEEDEDEDEEEQG